MVNNAVTSDFPLMSALTLHQTNAECGKDVGINSLKGKIEMWTSKKDSSQRQIESAIFYLQEEKLDCAITLAAAGEGILPATTDPHLFQGLQEIRDELNLNEVINWLKHPSGPEEIGIDEFEAVIVIARAITKFIAVYHQSCLPFEDFLNWAHAAGFLGKSFVRNPH